MRRYYLLNRPPSSFTTAPGWSSYEVWLPKRRIPNSDWTACGWVEYGKALTFDIIWKWEMRPADEAELQDYLDWQEEMDK